MPVPVEGKSPSAHGEFSTAQRLMEPMNKSPCPFLVPQVGLHPIPLGQLLSILPCDRSHLAGTSSNFIEA